MSSHVDRLGFCQLGWTANVVFWWPSSVTSLSDWPSISVYSTVGAKHCVARVCQRQRRLVLLKRCCALSICMNAYAISCTCQVLQDDLQHCVSAFESIDQDIISAGVMQTENRSGWFHNRMTYFYFAPVGVQSIAMSLSVCLFICLFVCLSACWHIWQTRHPNFTKFSRLVTCGHGSVLIWRQCNTLCSSDFVDDVLFLYNEGTRIKNNAYVLLSSPCGGTGGRSLPSLTVGLLQHNIISTKPFTANSSYCMRITGI